jgi:hypothetical protein
MEIGDIRMSKIIPGEVRNPHGRPPNTGHRQQAFNALVLPHKDALFAKAVEMALAGNERLLIVFLERLMPAKPIDEPILLDLPPELTLEAAMNMGKNILELLSKGEITPEQGKSLFGLLNFYQGNVAGHELLELYKKLQSDLLSGKVRNGFNAVTTIQRTDK